MASRDDMVIQPSLEERGKPSRRVDAARGQPKRGARRGRGRLSKVVAFKAAKRAATKSGASRLLSRVKAAAVATAVAGVIAKRMSGMTFEQMREKGSDVVFGEKAMKARAAGAASATLMSNMSMIAYHRESERARRTGTANRALADTAIVHGQLMQMELQRQRGIRRFILDDNRFRAESVADLMADSAGLWFEMMGNEFVRFFEGR